MSDKATFGRYAELTLDEMTTEQREAYSYLMDGPRGRLPGPYKVWIHNPKLVRAADPLGRHFTPGEYTLTERGAGNRGHRHYGAVEIGLSRGGA